MKHKRIKTYLKFGILLFGIYAIVIACQKDDAVTKDDQSIDVQIPTITTLSYETADAKFNQLKDQVKITKYLQVPEGSSLQGKSTKDTLGLTIATDIIKQVTFGDYTSYTMKIVYESDGTVFYNLTIEDKNGLPNVFITQYIPNDYWLNNKDEPFQGSIQSKNGDKLTVFNPDEGADEDNGGYEIDNNLGIGAGVGGTTGSYSANYPTDCFGTVIIVTANEAYQCGCGDWPWEDCSGCHTDTPVWPGYNQVILYGCEENWDNDLDDPNDTTDPGGISETDPINDVSIGVLVKEDEECLPEDARPYDYDNSCSLDVYESCRMNGNSHEICECVSNGGTLNDCQVENDCEKLNELLDTQKHDLNSFISDLAIKHQQNVKNEASYSLKKTVDDYDPITEETTYNYEDEYREGSSLSVSINIGGYWHSAIHLHPKTEGAAAGIFSWGDIALLNDLYIGTAPEFKETNNISLILLAPDPLNSANYNVYSLTVKNSASLTSALTTELNSPKWARYPDNKSKISRLNRKYGNKYKANKNNLERFFLDTYSNYGISLYKLENNQWDELLPSTTDQSVTKKPCN